MKTMTIPGYGAAELFELQDIDPPQAGPDEALIRVHGSSVNPLDAAIRMGMLEGMIRLDFPAVLGVDVSGEVVAIGENVHDFSAGDRVYAYTGPGAGGGYGELAAVSAANLAPVPTNLDLVTAGSVPGAGSTAFEAFYIHAPLEPGMRVFINGAAGGVGTLAIQVARAMGAEVTGTCSGAKVDLVHELGAEAIDYNHGDPFSEKQSYDVVFNLVRGSDENELRTMLQEDGKLVTVVAIANGNTAPAPGPLARSTSVTPFIVSSNAACLVGLSQLIESGAVEPVIERIYPLPDLTAAHQRVETGRAAGKVCVDVRSVWQER